MHTHIHTRLAPFPLMPMGALLLPGSYSPCLLPGTLLRALRLPCSLLEQKSWMSSDGPGRCSWVYLFIFLHLTLQPEREGFSSPQACLCFHVVQQSSFDKFLPMLALSCCPFTETGGSLPTESCDLM